MVECESFVAGRDPGDHDRQFLENSLVEDIQCCASSPAKHGGAYFSAVVWSTILATTEKAIGRPHAPPILVKFHLARTFGATGKEQPSPPLHLAAAARLLRQFRGQASKWDLFAQNHLDFSHFSF